MPITRPVNLQVPFSNIGAKNTIPVASQIGISNGAASFTDGFPPLTMTPIVAGGIPPAGQDFNGIFNILSQHTTFVNAGGRYRFDAALSTAIGGYPVGFVLQDNSGLNEYVNILAANTTDFNVTPSAIGISWMPYTSLISTVVTDPTFVDSSIKPASTGWVRSAMSAIAIAAGFAVSKTENGYVKLPTWLGGIIFQWGINVVTAGTATFVTLPIPFLSTYHPIASVDNSASATASQYATVSRNSNSILTLAINLGTSVNVQWLAIGY